jgi:transposase
MNTVDYIGFDVHKRSISFCVKDEAGRILQEGEVAATRLGWGEWAHQRRRPWRGGMEATLFTGWIYDFLRPHAQSLQVGHPAMMKAIGAAKKKNDRVDARTIADLLRCNLLPEAYRAPEWIRELRRVLRFRNLLVRQAVKMKNKIAGLLMETGTVYDKKRLHGKRYFQELLGSLEEVPDSVREMLRLSRGALEMFEGSQHKLLRALETHSQLQQRVELLQSIDGVGPVVALTWVLEVGEVQRFSSLARAISYCGLCSAQRSSAGKEQRGPLSKQRNQHRQVMLIEAAHLAPRLNPELAGVYQRERARGNGNRATLAVARKLVGYLLAVDRSGRPFQAPASSTAAPEPSAASAPFPSGHSMPERGGPSRVRSAAPQARP